ncbi:hypothetical protein MHBO_001532 [Bonamia ostreae]|uniref:Uncharacterized protein n=1 Tax=Bonamia ostreae TaxID=126728 RepID=A0ABV2AJB9_9EUKA
MAFVAKNQTLVAKKILNLRKAILKHKKSEKLNFNNKLAIYVLKKICSNNKYYESSFWFKGDRFINECAKFEDWNCILKELDYAHVLRSNEIFEILRRTNPLLEIN